MELPTQFCAADTKSFEGQTAHLRLLRIQIICTIAAAAVGILAPTDPTFRAGQASSTAFLFMLALIAASVAKGKGFDKKWYSGRAAAESTKSMSWKFAMKAQPYDADRSVQLFTGDVATAFKDWKYGGLTGKDARTVTADMLALRSKPWESRLQVYLRERVLEQLQWYGSKANDNEHAENRWFMALLALQALGIASAIARIVSPDFPGTLAGLASAGASSVVAWSNAKHHSELAAAYSQCAMELTFVKDRADAVNDEASLAAYVSDSENAISREHTSWRARREVR